jgi:NAD-dependent deacetylase
VDGLHTAAGNKRVIEMHGSLHTCFCTRCHTRFPMKDINLEEDIPLCPKCKGMLRPDIVWFGEVPYHLDKIDALLHNCDVFMVVGTSGVVYPSAGFVMTARYFGAHTIAVNLNPMENSEFIDEFYQGKAGEILPRLVDEWINSADK